MATVQYEPASVYSHPYRPEQALLRIRLAAEGYHPTATEAIVSYAATEGTVEGAPGLDPVDYEHAEWALETGCEAVPQTDPAWDEHTSWPGQGPVYQTKGAVYVADAWVFLVGALDRVCRAVPADAVIVPPELEPEPDPSDVDRGWAAECLSLPPISGGSPDPEPTAADRSDLDAYLATVDNVPPPDDQPEDDGMAFPGPHTAETRRQFAESVAAFFARIH
jgi:hypothetical protein